MYETTLLVGTLLSMAVFFVFMRSRCFSVFHPLLIYSAFHFLVFVIRPIFGVIYGYQQIYQAYGFTPDERVRTIACAVAHLGYLSFAFFSLRAGSEPMVFRQDAVSDEERRRLGKYFVIVAVICGGLGAYSLMGFYVANDRYFEGMVLDRATGISVNTVRNGYALDAQLMLISVVAACAWLGRFRLAALLPAMAFMVFRAGTGGRGPFVSAAVACLLLYLYDRRRRVPALRGIAAIAAAALAFQTVGVDRGQSLRYVMGFGGAPVASTASRAVSQPLETMDLANMEFLEYLVYVVPEKSGTYDYFLVNLQVFTEPIPRVWWPGKPIGAPIKLYSLFDYGYPIGMTQSLPGVGWTELGWAGVVIWCGLIGYVLGWIYTSFVRSDQSTLKTLSYMALMSSMIVGFRDGLLLTFIKQNGMFQLPLLVWFMIARAAGVPRLADMRLQILQHVRHLRATMGDAVLPAAANPDETGSRVDPREQALPLAVRRRRAALAARQTPVG